MRKDIQFPQPTGGFGAPVCPETEASMTLRSSREEEAPGVFVFGARLFFPADSSVYVSGIGMCVHARMYVFYCSIVHNMHSVKF